ncbi:5-(carboxyamino)imidazole ribonucleotide synthase [Corynebacterium freneyi]|uniref:N5-carboxyaminoimidazole ribonucleotide synthase n=2 Tax=Corynebacterium freneyi TaxID=134034 RepID=A0ABS4U583_9CORY|nr:5-(carboxyamino)imidazole ribonucleotide synthase [Corynebacterium freneyi]WJZ06066.1 N5-carboxyaminoimidazole ribonucleotide synthase [Corynebacterium freneyi]
MTAPENSQNEPADRILPANPAHAPGMPVVTVIGDGQLARMMQTAAIEIGQSVRLLAGSRDSSAAQICRDVEIGDYRDLEDLRRATRVRAGGTIRPVDAATFDHEHVPTEHLRALEADGISVQPGPDALVNAQDKLVMRRRLESIGAPVPPFAVIESVDDALGFAESVDGKVCLKARRGGYDGHGVWFPDADELPGLVAKLLADDVPLMAEKKVDLARELSAMCARTPSGEVASWPVVESVQRDGICVEAVAPAPGLDDALASRARDLSVRIARELGVTGVLAVELFETRDAAGKPEIFVNELAMRPHNTGHWTQDGAETDQFEQHMRAVLDYPLGDAAPTAAVTVMANTLGADENPDMPMKDRFAAVWRRFPHAKIHWYGKGYRAGRKLGHVNVTGADDSPEGVAATRREANLAAGYIVNAVWADGYVE